MKKVTKIILLISVLFIASFIGTKAINFYKQNQEAERLLLENQFENKIEILAKAEAKNVALKDITNFLWSEVCFYGPSGSTKSYGTEEGVNTVIFKTNTKDIILRIGRAIADISKADYQCYNNSVKINFTITDPALQSEYNNLKNKNTLEIYQSGGTYLSFSGN